MTTLRTLSILLLVSAAACSKSDNKPAPAAKATEPAPAAAKEPAPTPVESAKPVEAAKPAAAAAQAAAHDECYSGCLANGPDDSPMTKTDWPKKSKVDKENDCSAHCSDGGGEGMPVEIEEKMNKR